MESLNKIVGRNIRDLRKGKHLTQAELVGTELTRSMLSLIESGDASPSIQTLDYLSKRLGVPVGYFFTDDESETSRYIKIEIIGKIRELYFNHKYDECSSLCTSTAIIDDEIAYILANCEIKLAEEECRNFHLMSAQEHLAQAISASELTGYNPLAISQTATFLSKLIDSVETYEIDPSLCHAVQYSEANFSPDLFLYLHQLSRLEQEENADVEIDNLLVSPIYKQHISAKRFMISGDYVSAIPILKQVYTNIDVDFFTLFRVCGDLEKCSEALEDYRSAYKYSKRKKELSDQFKK